MIGRLAAIALAGAVCGWMPAAARAQASDPLEGVTVTAIRVTGLQHVSADVLDLHLETRAGQPFRRAVLRTDQRRLDELRLFTSVVLDPKLEGAGVVVHVTVTETMRMLPIIVVSVTDENGVSAGGGIRGINLLGHEWQSGLSMKFGGETAVAAGLDRPTVTPGTWSAHIGFNDSQRRNVLYEFDEHASLFEARFARNWRHGLRAGPAGDVLALDTGSPEASLSGTGKDVVPRVGGFFGVDTFDSSTNPSAGTWAEGQIDRLFGDADSWSFILDGRRIQRLTGRQSVGAYSLATLQTGEVGVGLPEYLQFALGGSNSIRGWSTGSRRGRNQYIGSLEYKFLAQPIRPFSVAGFNLYAGLQVVGFADVGLAWNSSADFKSSKAIDGYGFGLRALVPFADALRLDFAWGEPGKGMVAYFGVGLKEVRQRQRVR